MHTRSKIDAVLASTLTLLLLLCGAVVRASADGSLPVTVPNEAIGNFSAFDITATPLPSEVLHLTFALSTPNQDSIAGFVNSLTDPKSPNYHHFITAAEFGDRFGASQDDINSVVAYATSLGFTNISVWPDHQFVSADATVAQAEAAFGVSIAGYDRTGGEIAEGLSRTYYAPNKEPALDITIASKLVGIFGLSDMVERRPVQAISQPELKVYPDASTQGYLDPPDLAKAYDITSLHNAGLEGQGETIAIFSPTTYTPSDISSFLSHNSITAPNINVVNVNGGAPNNDDQVEACIDIETIAGQAPDAKINVYEGPNDGSFNIFEQVEADDPDILSESYGTDEDEVNLSYAQTYESVRQAMAAEGISVFVASGDWGAFDYLNETTLTTTVDSSSAYVTGVGGTELSLLNGNWNGEVAWTYKDGTTSGNSGSSGGLSVYYAKPSWQTGTGVSNTYSNGMRQVPDVAALASTPYYDIFTEGSFSGWGGTSCAAPLWASSVSLIEQSLGTRLGNIDPNLYSIAASHPTVYHDITSGNDGYYYCTTGWDYVTGWGSADFGNLLSAFGTYPTRITSFSPTSGVAGTTITVNGAGLAGATSGTIGGVPVSNVSQDTATQIVCQAPVGVKTGPIVVTTASGTATSIGTFVTPSFDLSYSNSAATVSLGGNTGVQVGLVNTGGFTGSVALTVSGMPTGVTASFNPTSISGSNTSTLTIFVGSSVVGGVYPLTIKGTSGSMTSTEIFTLTVPTVAPGFTINTGYSSLTIDQGGSTSVPISLTNINGFTGTVALTSSGAPTGITVGFAPTYISGTASSQMSVSVSPTVTAGSYPISINGASGTTTSSTPLTIVVASQQILTSVAVTPSSASLLLNGTQQFTASGLDQFGNPMATQPTLVWSLAAGGVGSIGSSTGLYSAGATAGTATVQATANGFLTGAAAVTVTVTDQPPTVQIPASASPNPVTGTTTNLSVLGASDLGSANLTYTWSFSSGPAAVAFSVNRTNAAQNTVATFTQAGTYNLAVTIKDSYGLSVTSSVVVTVVSVPSSLSVDPQSVTATVGGTVQFETYAIDQFGNAIVPAVNANYSVSGGGTINATTGLFTAATLGGPYTVTATSGAFHGTAEVTVASGAGFSLYVSPNTATVSSGNTSSSQNAVYINTFGGFTATGSIALSATGLPSGVTASFSGEGSNQLFVIFTAAVNAPASTSTVTITGTSPTYTASTTMTLVVSTAPVATSVSITPSNPIIGTNSSVQFTIAALDQYGNLVSPQPNLDVTCSTNYGTFNATTDIYAAGSSTGIDTLQAYIPYSNTSATTQITVLNATGPTVYYPAAANPNPVNGTSTDLSVLGKELSGGSLTYTWSATGPAPVTYSLNGTSAANDTVATFTAAGVYNFTVTITDAHGLSVASSVSVNVSQILTSITVAPANSDVVVGNSQTFTATSLDQFGDVIPSGYWSFNYTISGGGTIVSSTGFFTATRPGGPFIVTATEGAIQGSTTVTVSPNASVLTSITVSPTSASLGLYESQQFSAIAKDQNGNPLTSQPAFAWSVLGGGVGSISTGGVYFSGPTYGNATVQVTAGSISSTASVSVTSIQSFTIVPSETTVSVEAGFNASDGLSLTTTGGFDEGVVLSASGMPAGVTTALIPTNTISGTETTSLNFFVAANAQPGSYPITISGTSGSLSSSVQVTLVISAQTPGFTIYTSSSIQLPEDSDAGVPVSLNNIDGFTGTVALSVTGAPPGITTSFSPTSSISGTQSTSLGILVSATTPAGSYPLTISGTSGNLTNSATLTVNVTLDQWLSSIVVSPTDPTVPVNGNQQFTATGYDQFNNVMATQPTVTWSVIGNSIGSISQTGLFTAGGTSGSTSIEAEAYNGAAAYITGYDNVTVGSHQSFTIVPTETTINAPIGSLEGDSIGLTSIGGFSGSVALTVSGLPTGVTAAFLPSNTLSATQSSTLNLTVSSSAQAGSYPLTLSGTSGSLSSSVQLTLLIAGGISSFVIVPTEYTITAPEDAGTAMGVSLDNIGGFNGTVALSVIGAPTGVTTSFIPSSSISGTQTTSLDFDISPTTAVGDYPVTISGTSGTITSNVSVTLDVTFFQLLSSIAISPSTANLPLNDTQQFNAVGDDQFGNVMPTQPTFTWTTTGSNIGTISQSGLYTASSTAGTTTVEAIAQNSSGFNVTGQANVTIIGQPPTIQTPASANPNPVTGATTSLSVLGASDGGAANLTYTWSSTSGPATVNFSVNGTNVAQNTVATFTKSGTYNLLATITDTGGLSVTSSVTVIVNQTLTAITVSPATATVIIGGTQTFTASASDQFGNPLSTQPSFTYTVSGGGTIGASTGLFTATTAGGPFTVTATSGTVHGTASVTVSGTMGNFTISSNPSSGTVPQGTTVNTTINVTASGGFTGSVALSVSGLPSGVTASFNPTSIAPGATSQMTVNVGTDAALGTASVTVTGTSGQLVNTANLTLTVSASPVFTSIVVSPATAALALNATQQFTAVAKDQNGNPLTTQPTFTWSLATGAVGTVSASGLYNSGATAGNATIKATSGAITGTATATVTNHPPTVQTPALANPNPVTGTTTNLSVLGTDDGGAANLTYTWSSTSGPAGVTFSVNGTNAAQNTVATFTNAGTYNLLATITDSGGLSTTSSVSVTVNQTISRITVSPSSATVQVGGDQTFTSTAYDQFSNAMVTQPSFSYTVSGGGTIGTGSGVFIATTAGGPFTVTATAGTVQGTAQVTVNPAPSFTINANPATVSLPQGTSASTTLSLTSIGGFNGNVSLECFGLPSGVTAQFVPTSATVGTPSQLTFTTTPLAVTGSTSITIYGTAGVLVNTATVTLNVQANPILTTIAVSPTSVALALNGTQQFTALAKDQNGNPLISQPTFAWSLANGGVGSISASTGLYTAGAAAGNATVQATAQSAVGTATVTVTNHPPIVQTAASATPNPVTGATTNLSVLGADDGGAANLTYTWSASGPATVTFSVNGTNAAQNTVATFTKAGTYNFTATITDSGGLTVTSSVSVTINQTLTRITVTPSSASVTIGSTQTFTSTGYDQFGNAMTTQPSYAYTVSGGGTIGASTGLFTATTAGGPFTVTSTSGSIHGTASVTVTAAISTGYTVVATPGSLTVAPGSSGTVSINLNKTGGFTGSVSLANSKLPTGIAAAFSPNPISGSTTSSLKLTVASAVATGSYPITVDGIYGLTTETTTVTLVVSASTPILTSIAVSPTSSALALNATQQFTAVAKDQNGNPLATQPTVVWSLATGGVGSISASTGLYTAGATAGNATVQATAQSVTGTASVSVTNHPPTVQTAASATPNPVTGTTTNLSVLGADDGGAANLTYTWSASGPANVTFSANGTNAAQNTVATFTKAGTYNLLATITDSGGLSTTSPVTVTVNQTSTTVTVAPPSATVVVGNTQTFTGSANDQFGNALSTQPTFTYSVSGGGTIGSSTGLFTATTPGGPFTVTASAGTVLGTATVTVNSAPNFTVSANPTTVTVPQGTSGSTTVNVADIGGFAGSVALTYSVLPAGVTAQFSPASITTGAPSQLTFTATPLAATGSTTVTITGTSGQLVNTTTVTLNIQANSILTTIAVSPTSAALALSGTQQFTAIAKDQNGNPLTTQPTFAWTLAAGGVGSINASTGLYSAGVTAGNATVQATAQSVTGTASVSVTAQPPTVQTPASATPNPVTGTTTNLSVLGADDAGPANLTYTWSATGPATVNFSVNGTNAAQNTVATFAKAGTYNFTATITDTADLSTTSSVTVTVNQTATTITVAPPSATVVVGNTQTFSASANDQFGNGLTTQSAFTYSVSGGGTIGSSNGLFTATTQGGPFTVTAAAGAVQGTASVTVNPAPNFTVSANPTTVTVPQGTSGSTTVNVADIGGFAGSVALTYSVLPAGVTAQFSPASITTGAPSQLTFTATPLAATGSTTVTITGTSGQLVNTTTVTLNIQANSILTTIAVSPTSAALALNATQQFTAVAKDQNGNALATQPTFTWSIATGGVGTISTASLYNSGATPGNATVQATAQSVTGTATVTVTNHPPTVQTAASATPNPVTGTTTNTSVLGADDGGAANLTYTWSASGPAAVTFSVNGTNAAKNTVATFTKAGSYNLLATITDSGGLSVTSSVTVTVNQTLTRITVAPSSASVTVGSTQTFTSTGYDQFNNAMATQPSYAYTVSGGGTIGASTGLFTATTAGGPFTVTSTSGSIHGTASVTVTASGTKGFTLAATPSSLTIARGTVGTVTIILVNTGGFNSAVSLAVASLPTGVTDTLSANPISGSATSTLTLTVSPTTTVGTYTVVVMGSYGLTSQKVNITLTVD